MATKNKANIITDISNGIITGGRLTTASNVRTVLGTILDSYVNVVDCGMVYQADTGYAGGALYTPSNQNAFANKGYVDALVGVIPTYTSDNGITKTGSNFALGGALVSDTDITGGGTKALNLGTVGSKLDTFTTYAKTHVNLQANDGVHQHYFEASITNSHARMFSTIEAHITAPKCWFETSTGQQIINVEDGIGVRLSAANGNADIFLSDLTQEIYAYSNLKITLDATRVIIQQANANTVPYLGPNKEFLSSAVTPTELGYLSGVTSSIQTQINNINAGLKWKDSARVMCDTNITIATPGASLDGVAMSAGDRVLLTAQSTAHENGLYVWNGAASPMTRSTDADTGSEILQATCGIQEGTYADQIWMCSTNAPITIGVTNLTFVKTSATTYTAGTGLSLTGNQFAIDATVATLTGSQTFTNKSGNISMWTNDSGYITASSTDTLTNKRRTRRVVTTAQSATPTINTDNTDVASITGLAQAITSFTTNLTGTPVDGDLLEIRITDNGTARAITWGTSFESSGSVALPTTTTASILLRIGFEWNTVTSKWSCIAVC